MKANELRVGNLVYDDDKLFVEEAYQLYILKDYFEPIPLTEEWLLNFGFEEIEIEGTHYFVKDAFVFEYSGVIGFYEYEVLEAVCIKEDRCKYVHQLQNLYFALTGEELTLSE